MIQKSDNKIGKFWNRKKVFTDRLDPRIYEKSHSTYEKSAVLYRYRIWQFLVKDFVLLWNLIQGCGKVKKLKGCQK